jgi:hypothetical protein
MYKYIHISIGIDDQSTLNQTDIFDSELPTFSQSNYVPYKSIALARQDMTELDAPDRNNSIVEKLWPQVWSCTYIFIHIYDIYIIYI